ncbi:unnamed protein product [Taenia asiatica]|uniref:Transmembrane protein n=1 Tax=Taenia asiatica TaxID=60517 RepID=A0A0R3WC92_TAEAS|nr:unnamed protein product [Taenia asiatica]
MSDARASKYTTRVAPSVCRALLSLGLVSVTGVVLLSLTPVIISPFVDEVAFEDYLAGIIANAIDVEESKGVVRCFYHSIFAAGSVWNAYYIGSLPVEWIMAVLVTASAPTSFCAYSTVVSLNVLHSFLEGNETFFVRHEVITGVTQSMGFVPQMVKNAVAESLSLKVARESNLNPHLLAEPSPEN